MEAQLVLTMSKSPLIYIAMRPALKKPNYRLLVFAWLWHGEFESYFMALGCH